MDNIKVNKEVITKVSYETSDGRVFDDKEEAIGWQTALDNFKTISMLDSKLHKTDSVCDAFYVALTTEEQVKAFNLIQGYEGFTDNNMIPQPGYYCYWDDKGTYISVDKAMEFFRDIIDKLNS